MYGPVHVVAAGARTPVGLHAPASAAALRAGISGMGRHPFMVDHLGDPMPGAIDAVIDPGLFGPDRFLALTESALREACAPLCEAGFRPRLPLYLALPEPRPGFGEDDAQAVAAGIVRIERLPANISEVRVSTEGHAAGLLVLASALEQIRSGAIEACLVGGVESYFHPDTMEWLDDNRQLAGADARSAFVPGEGAGFCLLMGEPARERGGLRARVRVLAAAVARETKLIKTEDVCLGEGLTAAVRAAAARLAPPTETVGEVICDLNGERYRGEEWGFACLRLGRYIADPTAYRSPADLWGDLGAASGPLFVMLACQAAERGYAKASRTMLWASSEGGLRAAALLETTAAT
ncbi:MAG TPA: beta-ketoacyl synthase N-terminal-like domain-containing protein [Longimicrobium sp.]